MSEETSKLRIHTQITHQNEERPTPPPHPHRLVLPHPKLRRRAESSDKPRKKVELTFTDRLLRNSALACAALLAVLALGNIDQPWARRASETVERALTMHIDLDESIGQLSFVRNLMPESALVFLNLSGNSEYAMPVDGNISHPFTEAQPWLMFACTHDSTVRAVSDGTVTAVSELSNGAIGVLIDHGGGLESVYAYLDAASVQPGDNVLRGQPLGTSTATLYLELRSTGTPIDPSAQLGL